MRKISLILIFIITFCAACTVSEIITAEKTELNVASLNIPENLLLDIGILNFDLGVSKIIIQKKQEFMKKLEKQSHVIFLII